ncbi:MAG TPA: toprim domain-containing protein, partial [Longimicrobiales bacterium]|nr:toprim domain-containing protein [Longimicrobiales bacterium]
MAAIDDLAAEFARLPGIGRKTALRLTYHLLKQPATEIRRLAGALEAVATRVRACRVCGNLAESELCPICSNPRRDTTVICVVEEASDVQAIERAGQYGGLYHVLGGRLS